MLKQQEGSRAPAAGQPPEQTSVGSGAEGSCQAPDVLARTGGWFKPARLKLAAASNSALDSLLDNLAHPGPGDKYRDQLITKLSGTGILRLSILIALVLCGGFLHTGAVQLHLVLI